MLPWQQCLKRRVSVSIAISARTQSQQGVRWLIAAVSLNYVREAHFPDDVEIVTGLHHIGKTSWEIFSAAFQDGECVATCDTVMVAHGPEGRRHIASEMRDQMAQYFRSQGLISAIREKWSATLHLCHDSFPLVGSGHDFALCCAFGKQKAVSVIVVHFGK